MKHGKRVRHTPEQIVNKLRLAVEALDEAMDDVGTGPHAGKVIVRRLGEQPSPA